jgi:hypothetical protein
MPTILSDRKLVLTNPTLRRVAKHAQRSKLKFFEYDYFFRAARRAL